jgi:hypothetical protein
MTTTLRARCSACSRVRPLAELLRVGPRWFCVGSSRLASALTDPDTTATIARRSGERVAKHRGGTPQ